MTNKYKYFVANWKMFGNVKTINSLNNVIKLSKLIKFNKAKIIYCPPYTLLVNFVSKLKRTKIQVGAQNCHHAEDNGPFTGSINSKMIKNPQILKNVTNHILIYPLGTFFALKVSNTKS